VRRFERPKRPKLADSLTPWPCVVLAVDTASVSGWSIRAGRNQRELGEADTRDHAALTHIVRWALQYAERRREPLVLVLERPFGGERHTLAGLERAAERWMVAWRQLGQPTKRVVRVYPSTWRARVLGGQFVAAKREYVRRWELLVAERVLRNASGFEAEAEDLTNDEAAAVLIGIWAARAGVVGKALGMLQCVLVSPRPPA
jgi:hypothetical protein